MKTAARTELKREKGKGLNSIKTINRGSTESELRSLIPGGALVGRVNPQEQSGVQGSSGHREEAVPLLGGHLVEAVWVPQR